MPTMTTWTAQFGNKTVSPKVGSRFRMNSVSMIRQLAVLGLGIAFLPERIVAEDLKAGRLKRLLPEWQGAEQPVYAVTETRLLPAKTQRFIEFLKERLRET
jgi:DNA-binding transcriptional LysR family regulator